MRIGARPMEHGNMIESSKKVCDVLTGYADTNEVLGAYTEARSARAAIQEIEFLNRYITNLRTAFRSNMRFHVPDVSHDEIDKVLDKIEKTSRAGYL